jgi:microsomal dipeptidase-like Zn-dependent dipeptidase
MWGFADLHAHPASHLGFGADEAGNGGIFWGKPGLAMENAAGTIASDLPSCDGDKHGGFDLDPVRHLTRQTIINEINQITGFSHNRSGWPAFRDWPHPLSVLHQQMHISWIHRAYQGGLRLMIASVTDSQTLTMLWKRGFDLVPAQPQLDPDFEFESARRQLRSIERLVQANADWMEIVRTPGQAREAMNNNRLAIILSLEMDSLTVDQMVALRERFGVKHVTPIHLVNNRFGGVAAYGDLFNTSNYYLNGEFYHVAGDPDLKFRLGRPQFLTVVDANAVMPEEIGRDEYCGLGYECCPEQPVPGCVPADQGHKNVRGLARSGLRRLMEERFLIDLAHMSDHSQAEALELAEELNYPVMNSHTGLRRAGEPGESERDMRHSFGERIARLGGIIGLGTEGQFETQTLFHLKPPSRPPNSRIVRFTGIQREWKIGLSQPNTLESNITRLRVTIRTGGDNLRGGADNAFAFVDTRGGERLQVPLNDGMEWQNGSLHTVVMPIEGERRLGDIRTFGIQTTFGGDISGDNWDIARCRADYEVGGDLVSFQGSPYIRFTGARRSWSVPISHGGPDNTRIRRLNVTIKTGQDDLRGGNDNASFFVEFTDGSRQEFDLNRRAQWVGGSTQTASFVINNRPRVDSIQAIGIRTTFGGGVGGDNWDMDEIRVTYASAEGVVFDLSGEPLARFTGEQPSLPFYAADDLSADTPIRRLQLNIHTGADDIRRNSEVSVVLTLHSGVLPPIALNRGANWQAGTLYKPIIDLGREVRRGDIQSLTLRFDPGSSSITDTGDNWDIKQLQAEIISSDPVSEWVTRYLEALETMYGRGVAFGTDMNGFAPQVPFSARPVQYPINVAARFADSDDDQPPSLERHQSGTRTFDFAADGLAHYGLLPDFLQVISQDERMDDQHLAALFRTAEETILMWERVEGEAGPPTELLGPVLHMMMS